MESKELTYAVMALADAVREGRRGCNFTQQDLADALGCHISTIGHLERPNVRRIHALQLPAPVVMVRMEKVLRLEAGSLARKLEAASDEVRKAKAIAGLAKFLPYETERDREEISNLTGASPFAIDALLRILPDLLAAVEDPMGLAAIEAVLASRKGGGN